MELPLHTDGSNKWIYWKEEEEEEGEEEEEEEEVLQ